MKVHNNHGYEEILNEEVHSSINYKQKMGREASCWRSVHASAI